MVRLGHLAAPLLWQKPVDVNRADWAAAHFGVRAANEFGFPA